MICLLEIMFCLNNHVINEFVVMCCPCICGDKISGFIKFVVTKFLGFIKDMEFVDSTIVFIR